MKRISFLDKPGLLGTGVGLTVLAVALVLAAFAEVAVSERKLRHAVNAFNLDIGCAVVDEDWLRVRHIVESIYFPELSFVSLKAPEHAYTYPFSFPRNDVCGPPSMALDIKRYGVTVARLEACVSLRSVIVNLLSARSVMLCAVLAAIACGVAAAWPLWLHRHALARLTAILSAWARGDCKKVVPPAGDPIVDGLVRLVGETVQRREMLAKKAEHAKAMEELGAMAAQVAHDIRSPLSALHVALGGDDWKDDEMRTLAQASILRIKEIANHLLDKRRSLGASCAVPPEQTVTRDTICLCALAQEIAREQRVQVCGGVQVDIVVEHGHTTLPVRIEPSSLRRAVSNLTCNAVESLQGGGRVTLTVRSFEGLPQLLVQDTGCGMAPESLTRALAGGYTFGKEDGNGLGMAAARQIVIAGGGRFEINSELGVGTSVALTFAALALESTATQQGELLDETRLDDKRAQGPLRGSHP